MTTQVSVKVYLNETGGFMSYTPGDALHEAAAFEVALPACRELGMLLEIIWDQLNFRGEMPMTPWGRTYFGWTEDGSSRDTRKTHRSLSMGDVVILGETAWTPLSAGWQRVTNVVLM